MDSTTPYDASVVYQRRGETEMDTIPISQQMEASGIAVKQYAEDYADYTLFESSDALYGDLITPRNQDDAYAAMGGEEGMKNMRKSHLTLMGVSAYNKQMELQGREPVVLGKNQFAVNANYQQRVEMIERCV